MSSTNIPIIDIRYSFDFRSSGDTYLRYHWLKDAMYRYNINIILRISDMDEFPNAFHTQEPARHITQLNCTVLPLQPFE
jgi:hypothetical protein